MNQQEAANIPMSNQRIVWTKENILYEDPFKDDVNEDEDLLDEMSYKDDLGDEPMGMMPPMISLNNIFNLWNMHTSFKITEKIFNTIKNFDGVEVTHPISPYRMKVGFGYCFNDTIVRKKLDNVLINMLERTNE